MILTEYENGFYQSEEFKRQMNNFKIQTREELHGMLEHVFAYIRDPDSLISKEREKGKLETQDNEKILDHIDLQ